MRSLLAASLVFALLVPLGTGAAFADAPTSLAAASAQSRTDSKPILIEIGTSW